MRVAILGLGNIGSALFGALKNAKYDVAGYDPAVGTLPLEEVLHLREVVVIAVKPQVVPQVLAEIAARPGRPIIISVAAGVTTQEIADIIGSEFLIARVMPNLAMSLGVGMSTIYSKVLACEIIAKEIFGVVGDVLVVEKEELINVATAVCGSGPAFYFRFIGEFIRAAEAHGFSNAEAKQLVLQTGQGAIALLKQTDTDVSAWISKVATPGGTTEAGLKEFSRYGFDDIVRRALGASVRRASESMSRG